MLRGFNINYKGYFFFMRNTIYIMINVKYQLLDDKESIFNRILSLISNNLMQERKYIFENSICVYKILDFVNNENKIFIINFYYEKSCIYDFKQKFLVKIIKEKDEIIYIMESIGYIFITELMVKSFGFFWNDVFQDAFKESKLIYRNF